MNTTISNEVQSSQKIDEMVQELTAQVVAHSKRLEGVRPPNPELIEKTKKLFTDIGTVRGRPLYFPYVGSGLGNGAYVELEDGSVKIDFINGIGIHLMGHSHPKVIAAGIRGAMSDVVMQGNLQPNKEYFNFSNKMVEIASRNSRLRHVWLSTCGSLANENALKACRQKKNAARMIIGMTSAFAGRTTLMAEVTDNPAFKQGLPEYNEVLRVPFYDKNDPRSSEKSLNILKEHVAKHEGNICTFTFEPMQGEGGYNKAPREFFLPMLEFCREKQIPIWFDEVQTFCRTGQFFAYETLGLGDYVDVCTIAKTAQNGATLFTPEFNPKPGLIAGTFSGSSQSLSAGLEILNIIDKENYLGDNGKIMKIHHDFVGQLNKLNETTCKGLLRDAGGLGLMVAVTPLDGTKEKVEPLIQKLFQNGLIAFSCGRGPYRLRFLVPATTSPQQINEAINIIEKTILEMA
jgi:4-aminobutyrate aminotransferase-like enzyme